MDINSCPCGRRQSGGVRHQIFFLFLLFFPPPPIRKPFLSFFVSGSSKDFFSPSIHGWEKGEKRKDSACPRGEWYREEMPREQDGEADMASCQKNYPGYIYSSLSAKPTSADYSKPKHPRQGKERDEVAGGTGEKPPPSSPLTFLPLGGEGEKESYQVKS